MAVASTCPSWSKRAVCIEKTICSTGRMRIFWRRLRVTHPEKFSIAQRNLECRSLAQIKFLVPLTVLSCSSQQPAGRGLRILTYIYKYYVYNKIYRLHVCTNIHIYIYIYIYTHVVQKNDQSWATLPCQLSLLDTRKPSSMVST
jgi:hypothetical protein